MAGYLHEISNGLIADDNYRIKRLPNPPSRRTSCMQPCPCHDCRLSRQVLRGRTTDEYTDSEAEHMERRFSYYREQLFPLGSDSEDTSGSETSDSDN